MMKQRRRKCLNCGRLFRPDPRNVQPQCYCSARACRKARKTASAQTVVLEGKSFRTKKPTPNLDHQRQTAPKTCNFIPADLMQLHSVDSNLDLECER